MSETSIDISDSGSYNDSVSMARLNVCQSCEFFDERRFCSACGCFMPMKIRDQGSECPHNKWT